MQKKVQRKIPLQWFWSYSILTRPDFRLGYFIRNFCYNPSPCLITNENVFKAYQENIRFSMIQGKGHNVDSLWKTLVIPDFRHVIFTDNVHKVGAPLFKDTHKKWCTHSPQFWGWLPKIWGRKLGHENNLSRHLNGSANAPSQCVGVITCDRRQHSGKLRLVTRLKVLRRYTT